ncbi:hypothetical protein BZA70DRAFT_294438 [Myxozyma melibiosi]|uniref:DH domain-containing protein n=1 Tax=Myxozyma melibiosi TaxID=54550 RepID=A0ABR1F8G7_9ASCO
MQQQQTAHRRPIPSPDNPRFNSQQPPPRLASFAGSSVSSTSAAAPFYQDARRSVSASTATTMSSASRQLSLGSQQLPASLFQIAVSLITRLQTVPGLELYLSQARFSAPTDTPSMLLSASSFDSAVTPHAGASEKPEPSFEKDSNDIDPVTQLWRFLRQGTSLCVLLNEVTNALKLKESIDDAELTDDDNDSSIHTSINSRNNHSNNNNNSGSSSSSSNSSRNTTLHHSDEDEDDDDTSTLTNGSLLIVPDSRILPPSQQDLKTCKRGVYEFVHACKLRLGFADEDLFTVMNVFSDDTTDLLKVTRTVHLVLDLWDDATQSSPSPTTAEESTSSVSTDSLPSNHRSKVVQELLQTERRYVQDLERLHVYMKQLQHEEIVSADTIHFLFPNLNALVDFQRKFLVGVETNARMPQSQQRFGALFLSAELAFAVYETYASQQKRASDLAIHEAPKLAKLSHLIEPSYELPSILIKPIQRICKYPLLLKELLKYSPESDDGYAELLDGFHAMKRVTDRVNEKQRQTENKQTVASLCARIDDWKGHNIEFFGDLLYDGLFQMVDVDKEYHIYLFENILLFCKEEMITSPLSIGGRAPSTTTLSGTGSGAGSVPMSASSSSSGTSTKKKKHNMGLSSVGKKASLSSFSTVSISHPFSSSLATGGGGALYLEGRVYIDNVIDVTTSMTKVEYGDPIATSGYHLTIYWRFQSAPNGHSADTRADANKFSIRFRNEEMLRQWEATLRQLIESRKQQRAAEQANMTTPTLSNPNGFVPSHNHSNSLSAFAAARNRRQSDETSSTVSTASSNVMQHVSSASSALTQPAVAGAGGPYVVAAETGPARPPGSIKLRLSFHTDSYMVLLPANMTFSDMVSKVEKKLRLCNGAAFDEMVETNLAAGVSGCGGMGYRLKYRDEDGDMVVLESAGDWEVALESGAEEGVVDMSIY